MIPTFTRAYPAAAAIAGYRIVAFAAATSDQSIETANAATDALLGVSDAMGADLGGMCDVHRGGLVHVKLGGTVAAGDPLTADADGKAIKATPAAGANVKIIGFADHPGVSGDLIDVFIAPGIIQG